MSKHTPGPWELGADVSDALVTMVYRDLRPDCDDISPIAFIKGFDHDANARLIAAAPEMMDALIYAAEVIETARKYYPKSIKDNDTFRLNLACATVNKALAKAKGE